IMELHDAASLNAAVMSRVQQFAEGSADGAGEAAEMVADGLSALGLYITALQQGSASAKETLVPALLRFGLLQPEPIGLESVVQLVDAPGAEVDKELLEIFLEEAAEVVATIESSLATMREAPHDRESLTTIRRGFHTLKGSGRMVGLMDLGEMAWQCEQVMNKWL